MYINDIIMYDRIKTILEYHLNIKYNENENTYIIKNDNVYYNNNTIIKLFSIDYFYLSKNKKEYYKSADYFYHNNKNNKICFDITLNIKKIINYIDELWISKIYDNKKYYKKYYFLLINILNSQYFNNINYKIYILYNYNKNKNKLNFEKLYINNFFIHYNYLITYIIK